MKKNQLCYFGGIKKHVPNFTMGSPGKAMSVKSFGFIGSMMKLITF